MEVIDENFLSESSGHWSTPSETVTVPVPVPVPGYEWHAAGNAMKKLSAEQFSPNRSLFDVAVT
jgi:hypothetical protein